MAKRISPDSSNTLVNFRMSDDELERLDRLASKGGLNRSQFLRNLVVVGLEETEAWEKIGIVRAAITVRDVLQWMGEKSKTLSESTSSETEKIGKMTV